MGLVGSPAGGVADCSQGCRFPASSWKPRAY